MTRTAMPGMSSGYAQCGASAGRPRVSDTRQVRAVGQDVQDREVYDAFRAPQHVHAGGQHIRQQAVGQEVGSASSRSPRLSRGSSLRASGCSRWPAATAPPPARPGSRTRPARPRGPAGTAGRRRCRIAELRAVPAVAGTSRHRPWIATSRIPATYAVTCSSPASGADTASSSRAITCQRSRCRAWVTAAGEGCIPAATREPELPRHSRPAHQLVPYLAIARLEEQHHRQQQVHHHAGGQRPLALLPDTGLIDNAVDQLGREHLRSTPIPIRSGSRSPLTTCCPRLATQAILHGG